jgi:uncharacterized protein YjbJ (UPF0337 family)
MNKDQLRGKAQNLKGRAKEAAGALTGRKRTQAEGLAERTEGALRQKVGQVKRDTAREIDKG